MNPFKASVAFNIETSYFLYSKTKDWFPYEMQPLGWNWLNQVKTGTRKDFKQEGSLHRKLPLRISSLNVTKSAGNSGFGHMHWRNP